MSHSTAQPPSANELPPVYEERKALAGRPAAQLALIGLSLILVASFAPVFLAILRGEPQGAEPFSERYTPEDLFTLSSFWVIGVPGALLTLVAAYIQFRGYTLRLRIDDTGAVLTRVDRSGKEVDRDSVLRSAATGLTWHEPDEDTRGGISLWSDDRPKPLFFSHQVHDTATIYAWLLARWPELRVKGGSPPSDRMGRG